MGILIDGVETGRIIDSYVDFFDSGRPEGLEWLVPGRLLFGLLKKLEGTRQSM